MGVGGVELKEMKPFLKFQIKSLNHKIIDFCLPVRGRFGAYFFCMGHLFYFASAVLLAENVGDICTLRLLFFHNEEKLQFWKKLLI